MIDQFYLNGVLWRIYLVDSDDEVLWDRTGKLTVATTDPISKSVYLSKELKGDFLMEVCLHELGHCCMVSFNLLDTIHTMVKPEYWIDAEEWICNFVADYGKKIFSIAYSVLGYKAWEIVPGELEKLIA